ncbi:hypothetical protein ATCC90586_009215 [Pythium insidiosum]|nr:hypothetical protein ATCC90586_009215 [Pythium insidiosum]
MASPMEQALGPRWSQKELRAFYILLKAVGKQWERLEERLPQRSQAMIRALYEMHSGYLSLPEASAEGFCAIMMDRYKTMDETARQVSRDGHAAAAPPSSIERKHPRETEPVDHEASPTATAVLSDATRSKKKRKLDRLLSAGRDDRRRLPGRLEVDGGEPSPPSRTKKSAFVKPHAVRRRGTSLAVQRAVVMGGGGASCSLDLPWYYWFYSYIDADFFRHNEFIECLERMGLGKITRAARPVWASVRASMGRPRRLSRCFLAQEKQKLYSYRSIKARGDPTPVSPVIIVGCLNNEALSRLLADCPSQQLSPMWPYQKTAELQAGLTVIVRLEHPRHFALATIENFSLRDGVCKVRLQTNSSRVCSLESVMIPLEPAAETPKADQSAHTPSLTSLPTTETDDATASVSSTTSSIEMAPANRHDKVATILVVKDLLKRKEMLVDALSSMNEQARALHAAGGADGSAPSIQSSSDGTVFQRQYAWLVVNLDVTNRYLKAALLRLHDFSSSNQAFGPATMLSVDAPSETRIDASSGSCSTSTSDSAGKTSQSTLTLEQMRWAVNFLTQCRKKASELVKDVASTFAPPTSPRASADDSRVLPETQELISNCAALFSVIRRGASPSISPLITQKLLDRMFELLEPRFDANMDIYAELRSAVEGAVVIHRQQPS